MNHAAHGTHPHHVHADHKPLNTCKNNHSMMDDHHSMMQVWKSFFKIFILFIQMSFHGGFVETILFEPWKTTSITSNTLTNKSFQWICIDYSSFYCIMGIHFHIGCFASGTKRISSMPSRATNSSWSVRLNVLNSDRSNVLFFRISKEEDVNELEPMNTEAPTQEPKQ